jgi:hypothetical protein
VLSIGMTLALCLLVWLGCRLSNRLLQIALLAGWAVFVVVWFGVGLRQIADGLL